MKTVALAVLATVSTARAGETNKIRAAIAVNPPVGWFTPEKAVGLSAYVAPTKRHVIRANFARYWWPSNQVPALLFRWESDGIHDGTNQDVSLGWMWFPRRAFDGFSIELGILHRTTHSSDIHDGQDLRDTTYIAMRTLVGWNWSIRDRVFMSFHVGMSNGFSNGTRTSCDDLCSHPDAMPTTRRIGSATGDVEGFWRIGVAFDVI